jgi:hypothetical protein
LLLKLLCTPFLSAIPNCNHRSSFCVIPVGHYRNAFWLAPQSALASHLNEICTWCIISLYFSVLFSQCWMLLLR